MIGITELVSKLGDENVKVQSLDRCATRMKYDHKKGSEITFCTDQPVVLDGTRDIGLVLWLDREKVKQILGT